MFAGELEQALEWTHKLLKKDPKHPRAVGNVPHYEKAIAEREERRRRRERGVRYTLIIYNQLRLSAWKNTTNVKGGKYFRSC